MIYHTQGSMPQKLVCNEQINTENANYNKKVYTVVLK